MRGTVLYRASSLHTVAGVKLRKYGNHSQKCVNIVTEAVHKILRKIHEYFFENSGHKYFFLRIVGDVHQ